MARADLLCDIIKYGVNNDHINFKKAAEAICAEERANQHAVLANKIEEILRSSHAIARESSSINAPNGVSGGQTLFVEKNPTKRFDQLVLPHTVLDVCNQIVGEQNRAELLRSYGLEPRNKILFVGAPGNGKTSLAEAIADALMVPLLTVKYESIVGSYLGETASRLAKLFEYVKTRQCVLFFDEFETLGKERGDTHETGEIKRVVSSLLLQIDALPSYVVAIAATNHESILDKAAWRRFQIKLELPKPTRDNIERWFEKFSEKYNFNFGYEYSTLAKRLLGRSYSEVEEFALSVYRQYILQLPNAKVKNITQQQLRILSNQVKKATYINPNEGEENK